MGWFSPVKGSYPSLAQVDKALPVNSAVASTAIERGTILAVGSNGKDGEWILPTATSKMLYVALQDYNDPTAGFAGESFNPAGGTPVINGIDLAQDGEYETTVFDDSVDYAVGDALYANASGQLSKIEFGAVVGYVTRGKTDRWINNAIALREGEKDPRLAIRTGAKKAVIRFKTAV